MGAERVLTDRYGGKFVQKEKFTVANDGWESLNDRDNPPERGDE
jgi:hypothetical protein